LEIKSISNISGAVPYLGADEDAKSLKSDSLDTQIIGLRSENSLLKDYCSKLNQSIADLVKVRKAIFEKKIETKQMKINENHFFTELKKEMFSLDHTKLADFSLPELSSNLSKFKYLMDLIDSFNFNIDLKKSIEFDPVEELEIEQIKTISNLKDTIRNQKFILD